MTAAGMKPAVYLLSQEFLELDDAAENPKVFSLAPYDV